MSIEIREQPEVTIAGFRHDGPPDGIGAVWEKFGAYMKQHPELINENTQWVSVFYNCSPGYGFAAITVDPSADIPGDLSRDTIPAGKYAGSVHVGPYEGLKDAWGRFCDSELSAAGLEHDNRPCFEVYLNDPDTTPEAELQTQMWLSVK